MKPNTMNRRQFLQGAGLVAGGVLLSACANELKRLSWKSAQESGMAGQIYTERDEEGNIKGYLVYRPTELRVNMEDYQLVTGASPMGNQNWDGGLYLALPDNPVKLGEVTAQVYYANAVGLRDQTLHIEVSGNDVVDSVKIVTEQN